MSGVLALQGQYIAACWSPVAAPSASLAFWALVYRFHDQSALVWGKNAIMTCLEGLFGFVRVVPCYMGKGELSALQVASLFFNAVVRLFGLPDEVLYDRDPRFTADFWMHLWDTMGSRAVFNSAYHP